MSEDQLIGKKLANYRIQHRLGQGGMATVYYATDFNLDRPVAIKLIDARHQGDPEVARRFVDEARLVARWRNENIIQVYYAGQEDDIFFFAMEYIEGMSLGDLMDDYTASGEFMSHADVLKIGRAVANALDYAHQQGVIHRDVKPSNVMISYNDRVVLADFGLALDVERGTMGQIFGTPHYISPEQVRSSADVVSQSDIYSLGVMMFEMLTGTVPFDDPSSATLALQHLTVPPPSPRSINPELNIALEAILLKSLEKEADKRYQTGAALMDALEAAFESDTTVQDNSLPLPPAAVGGVAQRQISRLSVSEKIALHLEDQPKPPTLTRPKAAKAEKPTRAKDNKKSSQGRRPGLLVGGVVILLLIIIGAGALILSSNRDGGSGGVTVAVPTLAALNSGPTTVAVVLAASDTPAPTTVLSDTPLPSNTPEPATVANSTPLPASTMTHTAIPSSTPTNTVMPSSTPMNTVIPSSTPINTLAPTSTPTNTVTPTNTLAPTATVLPPTTAPQQVVATPLPTVLYPNGRRIQLYWDDYSFYAWNGSGSSVRVSPLLFEALDANGNPLSYAFEGGQWSRFFHSVENNKCDGLEIGRAPAWLRPGQCRGYNGVVNPTPDDPMVFWTGHGGSTRFRVLWNGQEVARCDNIALACQVLLPPE